MVSPAGRQAEPAPLGQTQRSPHPQATRLPGPPACRLQGLQRVPYRRRAGCLYRCRGEGPDPRARWQFRHPDRPPVFRSGEDQAHENTRHHCTISFSAFKNATVPAKNASLLGYTPYPLRCRTGATPSQSRACREGERGRKQGRSHTKEGSTVLANHSDADVYAIHRGAPAGRCRRETGARCGAIR